MSPLPFPGNHVYLASRSPRRRELLKQIGITFELLLMREGPQRAPDIDETPYPGERPRDYVTRLAREKASAGWRKVMLRRMTPHPVLAADTSVVHGDRILGKPRDESEAREMLSMLSGQAHQVFTAVSVAFHDRLETALSASTVEFRHLDDIEIRRYVASGEPFDKAGAYAVQGRAAIFVRELRGSYSGVVGLPLFEVAELLRGFEIAPT